MLLTLSLATIISGSFWPGLLLALVVFVLLPLLGLGLLVRCILLLRKGVGSTPWLMMGLAFLLLAFSVFTYLTC
jgi:hypothetical protein